MIIIIWTSYLQSIFYQYYYYFKQYNVPCMLMLPHEYFKTKFKYNPSNTIIFSTYYILKSIKCIYHQYILLQIEQYTNRFTSTYKNYISSSLYTIDYSIHNSHLYNNVASNKIIYSPLLYFNILKMVSPSCATFNCIQNKNNTFSNDIVFYGALNERRLTIINKLKKHFSIIHIKKYSIFNLETVNKLKQCKVSINIHYLSSPAILETARLNELISAQIPIISEKSTYEPSNDIYNSFVYYIDKVMDDYSNMPDIIQQIQHILDNLSNYSPDYDQLINYNNIEFKKIKTIISQFINCY
jgi:hypothetical protein